MLLHLSLLSTAILVNSLLSQSFSSPPSCCCWASFFARSMQGQQTICQQFKALSGPLGWQQKTNVKTTIVLQIWEFLCAIKTYKSQKAAVCMENMIKAQTRQISVTCLQACNPKASPIHLHGKFLCCHLLFTCSQDHQCIQSVKTTAVISAPPHA